MLFKNKYRNKKVQRDNKTFASKGEAGLYDYLKGLENDGHIKNLKCQVQVYLTEAKILSKPDFSYETQSGETIYAEFKGFSTSVWKIKRRLWKVYGPGRLDIYKGYGRMYLVETIIPTKKFKKQDQ